ncbi:MAG TPA: 16S rRNA (cytidine(1402)-2'-O)-methyltransferase [Candidatus Polarisedimenticolia bacterium]|nr:16S rRNA (cytidine(1402)-2'-O)-methyltransferase [Candidatus Polarisedimenticolia bacterium]
MSQKSAARAGTLYVVGTPIGNLDDLAPRAVRALAESDVIACEDTRTSRALLRRHGLSTHLMSHHKFNEARSASDLLQILGRGRSVALVTDGGTPGISDPGALLVRRAREAGHRIVPIPGPSAATALLSVSGFPPGPFTFVGFLPHRQGERRRALEALRSEPRPLLLFEAPHRILATLEDALAILGDREAILGRELTKLHEELLSGTLSSIRAELGERAVRGEMTVLIAGPAETPAGEGDPGEALGDAVRRLVEAGYDRKEAMRLVARRRGLSRRDVYRELLARDPAKA